MGICLPIKMPIQHKLIKAKPLFLALCPSCKKGDCKQHTKDYMSHKGNVTLCRCDCTTKPKIVSKPIEKVIPEKEKTKPVLKPTEKGNIFGIEKDTMLYTDLGRITKAGFILEFYKLRNGFCLKLYDEIRALLDTKAFMVSSEVHYQLLLNSFDRVCLAVYARKEKLTIEQMRQTIKRTMLDIQSNIVSNICLIIPD